MQKLTNKDKNYILLLLTAMFFLGVSATDIYIASLPQMVIDFNTSPSTVNLTLSSYSLGIAVAVLFVGEVSSRYGRRLCLVTGMAAFSLAALLVALVSSIEIIILLRIIQAVGCAALIIVPRLILKDCLNEREQIRANGILLMGLIISPALAPLIGAYLAEYFGWRSCFVASAFAGTLLCYLTAKYLPETNSTPITSFPSAREYLLSYTNLLTNRVFMALTLIYACGISAYFAFIGISSYLYINHWHLTPLEYSSIFFYLSAAYLMGNQVMQLLNKRRLATIAIIGIGVYSTLLGTLIVAVAASLGQREWQVFLVTVGIVFMRAANALINPPTQIRIMNYFHTKSAQALGLNICIGFTISSAALYLVTLFPLQPLLSLLVVSGGFVSICVVVYRANIRSLS